VPDPDFVGRNQLVRNVGAGTGIFIFADGGALVAVDAASGRTRWRTPREHLGIPAVVGTTVVSGTAEQTVDAYATGYRSVDAFSLADGTPRWRVDLPASRPQPLANLRGVQPPRFVPAVAVSPVADGLLVSTNVDTAQPYQQQLLIEEIDTRGALRWRYRSEFWWKAGRLTALHDGVAYLASVEDGATITDVIRMVRTGARGGMLGTMNYTIGPLGWMADGNALFLDAFSIGSGSFGINIVDPRALNDGDETVERTTLMYAPDGLSSYPGFGDAAIDGGFIYGFIRGANDDAHRLYRYELAPADTQRPLLLATGLTNWTAGTVRGWNVVEDGIGLLALRVNGTTIERVRLANYGEPVSVDAAAFDGHRLYVARYDGRVQGFDLDRRSTILDAPTNCVPDDAIDRQHAWRSIGVHGDRIIAVCTRRVYAFATRAGP
jgi:outer membrane protein assembly factor BamB